jgi:hypothetical protein
VCAKGDVEIKAGWHVEIIPALQDDKDV